MSIAIDVALVALLALVLRSPQTPATEAIHARTVQPAAAGATPAGQEQSEQSPEPLVRQIIPGGLETVTLDPPDRQSEISNATPPRQEAVIDPPAQLPEASAVAGTGSEAHPAVPPKAAPPAGLPPAEDPVPGMEGGSRLPPDLLQAIDAMMQGKFKRRTPSGRHEGVRYGGGTPQSEEAVERALRWLAAHQRQDGSWNFNHLSDACQHYCTHPGNEASTTAATGLALLPFLGAGYTHKEGEFQEIVGADSIT